MKKTLAIIIALASSLSGTSLLGRTWTDSTGAFTVEAELIAIDGQNVRLKRTDGRVLAVPIERLSPEDRRYLAAQAKKPQPAGGQARLDAALAAPTPVDFVRTPLSDVLSFLATTRGIDLVLDRRELQNAGIATNFPVTLSTDQMNLEKVLDAVLGASGLAYYTLDGVVVVTSKKRAEMAIYPRVYKYRKALNARNLVRELTRNIAPQSWADVGGPASLSWTTFCLVISQTRVAHAEIESHYAELLAPVELPNAEPDKALAAKFPVAKLDRTLRVEFVDTPLSQAAAFLGDQGGLPVMLDARALQGKGVAADARVTLALKDVRLRTALELLCRQLGVAWTADATRVLITDPKTAEKSVELVSYPARDLADSGRFDLVEEIISSTVAPSAWDDVGGAGDISGGMRGTLDVRQTLQIQLQVNRLLAEIRAARRR